MGCSELFYYEKLALHEKNCPYELVTCETCQVQMRISEKTAHNCVESLKEEVMKLKKTAKARCLFYAQGGDNNYFVFDEAILDWEKFQIIGEFTFPLMSQFLIAGMNSNQAKLRIFGVGGIREQIVNKSEGGNKVISEKLVQPTKETYEIFIHLQSIQPKKDMKYARSMFAATIDSNQIFVAGGINKDKEDMKSCEVYDIKQNIWTSLPDLNQARSSASLIAINQSFLYIFGGYPIASSSIEVFYEKFFSWKPLKLFEGEHIIHPFWAGTYLSDKMEGTIFVFGGGEKYNDTCDCYEFNADAKTMRKMHMVMPEEDRFFYNQ